MVAQAFRKLKQEDQYQELKVRLGHSASKTLGSVVSFCGRILEFTTVGLNPQKRKGREKEGEKKGSQSFS